MKHYSDYLQPRPEYRPVMTRDGINATPKTWLSFYPHKSFAKILRELLTRLEKGERSVWITGTYGSGKTYAALVLQKLFSDEDDLVEEFFSIYKKELPKELADGVRAWRKKRVLCVYEYGSDDVSGPQQLVWRIERAVLDACQKAGLDAPAISGAEELLRRVERDEKFFFETRDTMQGELAHLTPDIKDAATLRSKVEADGGAYADGLLQDADRVLQRDNIYLSTSAEKLLDWIDALRKKNGLAKVVFIWDEFSDYVNKANGDLMTFQKLAEEKAQQCGFHFVPTTHMGLSAFFASGVKNAEKVTGRFESLSIEIPAGWVFRLGENAFLHKNEKEWKGERDALWNGVSGMVETYMMPKIPEGTVEKAEDFAAVLPLHPMSAILLLKLSEKVGQNVRSFFDFLRATGDESEFERFLLEGGPEVEGRRLLAADYLWHYFVEKPMDGVSPDPAVIEVGVDFAGKKKTFGWEDGCPEERVYKAALLYTLMDRKAAGSDLVAPTVENLKWAFQGDGAIPVGSVPGIVEKLEKELHCFAVVNGFIQRYVEGDTKGLEEEKERHRGKFGGLVAGPTAEELQKIVSSYGDAQRYVVRGFDVSAFRKSDLKGLSDFGDGSPAQGNKIAVVALFAKDHEGKLLLPERAKEIAQMFAGLRVAVVYCDNLSFCDKRESRWEDFVTLKARCERASDEPTRTSFDTQMKDELADWCRTVRAPGVAVTLVLPDAAGGEPTVQPGLSWTANAPTSLKARLVTAKNKWLSNNPDAYAQGLMTVLSPKLASAAKWAEAGLTGIGVGQFKNMVERFKSQGIEWKDDWFDSNPQHPLTALRDFFEKKIKNAISNGTPCSVRKAHLELRRAPWGLEKNAYAAFAIGFALRPWLERGLQWTNGQMTDKLDEAVLSDIIAKVVEADGDDIRDEKLVCKLSREEKSFAKNVAALFGLPADASVTPEGIVSQLGPNLGTLSDRVPLWMLPPYIRSLGTESAEDAVCEVLDDLCAVLRTSAAKSKDSGRLEKTKRVGELLDPEKNPGVKEAVAKYLLPETFAAAFDRWLAEKAPDARKLAAEIGDADGLRLRDAVKSRFAPEAGWLWTEVDVAEGLADIEARWRFVRAVRILHGPVAGWTDYEEAQGWVRKAALCDNHVALDALAQKSPFVGKLAKFLAGETPSTAEIDATATCLKDEEAGYRACFRDVSHQAALEVLSSLFADSDAARSLTSEDWRAVHDTIKPAWTLHDAATFRDEVWPLVEKRAEESFAARLSGAWKSATGSDSPDDWAKKALRPAETLFADAVAGRATLRVLAAPSSATEKERTDALRALKGIGKPTDAEIDKRFLDRFMPPRYAKLRLPAQPFAEWLAEDCGAQPNGWREHPGREKATDAFAVGSYKQDVLPKVKNAVAAMDEKKAKNVLLDIVARLPEAGIGLLS